MDETVRAQLPKDCAMVDGTLPEDGESHQVGDFDVRVDHGAEFFQTSRQDKPCVLQEMLGDLGRLASGSVAEVTESRSCGRCGLFVVMTAVRRDRTQLAEGSPATT